MKSVALLARKGGAGKTTVAVHVGVAAQAAGQRVILFDLDPQRSLGAWWQSREAETPTLVETDARRLPDLLREAEAEGYGLAVIDTPPALGFDTAAVASIADLTLIPCRPSVLDIFAIEGTAQAVQASRRRGLLVLNGCPPPSAAGDAPVTVDARAALAAIGLPIARTALAQRIDYARALNTGEAVGEFAPGSKAAAEVARLWAELAKELTR